MASAPSLFSSSRRRARTHPLGMRSPRYAQVQIEPMQRPPPRSKRGSRSSPRQQWCNRKVIPTLSRRTPGPISAMGTGFRRWTGFIQHWCGHYPGVVRGTRPARARDQDQVFESSIPIAGDSGSRRFAVMSEAPKQTRWIWFMIRSQPRATTRQVSGARNRPKDSPYPPNARGRCARTPRRRRDFPPYRRRSSASLPPQSIPDCRALRWRTRGAEQRG